MSVWKTTTEVHNLVGCGNVTSTYRLLKRFRDEDLLIPGRHYRVNENYGDGAAAVLYNLLKVMQAIEIDSRKTLSSRRIYNSRRYFAVCKTLAKS